MASARPATDRSLRALVDGMPLMRPRPPADTAGGAAQISFLLNATKLEQLRDIAYEGNVMPQKSTDFYPKVLSGLILYSLEEG